MKSVREDFNRDMESRLYDLNMAVKTAINQSALSGARKSSAKGSSLEFSDYRDYTAGDDLRRIDWSAYARFNRLFIKLFMEEKQADINIYLDCSTSMGFYEEKAYYSKMIALCIAYISIKNTDRVNIFCIGENIYKKKVKLSSSNRFPEIMDFIDNIEYKGKTNISGALKEAVSLTAKRGISFVISDFFSDDGYEAAFKALQFKNQSVIFIQVLSKEETNPSIRGALRLLDCENNSEKSLEINESIITEYKNVLGEFQRQIKEYCTKRGGEFFSFTPEIPILKALTQIIQVRS